MKWPIAMSDWALCLACIVLDFGLTTWKKRGAGWGEGSEHRMTRPESATTSFFEEKYQGPDSVMLGIAVHGWVGATPPTEGKNKKPKR